jgi:hypothetical protein
MYLFLAFLFLFCRGISGLMIRNVGYGTAYNMKITSGQPNIVDNQKGLAVIFTIIGSQVGTRAITPSLTVDLGSKRFRFIQNTIDDEILFQMRSMMTHS